MDETMGMLGKVVIPIAVLVLIAAFLDFIIGHLAYAIPIGIAAGGGAYWFARRRQQRNRV